MAYREPSQHHPVIHFEAHEASRMGELLLAIRSRHLWYGQGDLAAINAQLAACCMPQKHVQLCFAITAAGQANPVMNSQTLARKLRLLIETSLGGNTIEDWLKHHKVPPEQLTRSALQLYRVNWLLSLENTFKQRQGFVTYDFNQG